MNSSKSSQKRTVKDYFEELTGFDLFYQLIYMSATSGAGLSRNKVFSLASKLPCGVSHYFGTISELVQNLQYDYPSACRMVANRAKEDEIKSFLLRLADALESGEPMTGYLGREANAQGDSYANEYERDIESLKKWTDAYSSLIISEALLVIINLISTMIYDMSTGLMAGLSSVAVLMSFLGAWVLSKSAPQETMAIPAPAGSEGQQSVRRLARMLGPVAVAVGGGMLLLGASWTWIMFVSAAILAPVGILAGKAEKLVSKKESEISPFLRSLGGMSTSTGTTLTLALGRMEMSSFPTLESDIKRLEMRLQARIAPDLCWRKFGEESGSLLISQAIGIFQDAVSLGGDPDEVSSRCSVLTSLTAQLRAKRQMVAATFFWLTVVMHGALALLLVLVLEIVFSFKSVIEGVMDPEQVAMAMQSIQIPLLTFDTQQVSFLRQMTIGMVLLLTAVNAVSLMVTEGTFKPKVFHYLSILLAVSGIAFAVAPVLVRAIM